METDRQMENKTALSTSSALISTERLPS